MAVFSRVRICRKMTRPSQLIIIGCFLLTLYIFYALWSVHVLSQQINPAAKKASISTQEQMVIEHTRKYQVNWHCVLDKSMTPWQLAESFITSRQVTSDNDNRLGCVLKALNEKRITHADVGVKGTQLKLSLTLAGEQRAVFKPKFYDMDYVMIGTPYAGKDRHYAEIAAFHLNRIIGLNKVPIVVGRSVNIDREIRPVAHHNLLHTFYYEKGSSCFYGKCTYCKGPETGVCAKGSLLEGSLTLWLPDAYPVAKSVPHPWRRTYNSRKKAQWETDRNYCQAVKDTRPYETPPRLLDLIAISIFDFIISNADRHHYETLEFSKDSMVIALDNGKAFGNPYHDEQSILSPLLQCCMIRKSFFKQLKDLSGILGSVLRNVIKTEPLQPILTDMHFTAVDRRLKIVLDAIDTCEKVSKHQVLIDDGYT